MSNFVSEDFTDEFMMKLGKECYYVMGAECGAGKTTAIMEKLVPFADSQDKKVLYVCNRVTLKEQLYNKYNEEELKKAGIVAQDECLTIGMYQSITSSIERKSGFLDIQKWDYIVLDEAHLIYDSADYDFDAFLFLEFINKLDAVFIFMSGTPRSIKKLQPYMSKPLKLIRETDYFNNPIRGIYLVEDKTVFEQLRFNYVNEGYKWIELVSRSSQFQGLKSKYKNYGVATLLANSNKNKELYMPSGGYDELILERITNNEELGCDLLFTTKFLDVGVNIQAKTNFVAAFNCTEMMNTMEQFRSRIRVDKREDYQVDLIIYVQRPKKWQLENLQKKLNYINNLYEEYGNYEGVVMKHNQVLGERFRRDGIISEKEFNPITKALLEDKLEFFNEMYYTNDLMGFYKKHLKEIYPTKDIINYKAVDIKAYLEKLMKGLLIRNLSDEQQRQLRQKMKEFKIDPKHCNELPHLKRINAFLEEEKCGYVIENPRVWIDGKQKRIWRLIKCAV